jgi:hypothetical protein
LLLTIVRYTIQQFALIGVQHMQDLDRQQIEEFLRTKGVTRVRPGLANAPSPLTRPEVAKRAVRRSNMAMSQKAREYADGMKRIFESITNSGITENDAIASELNELKHKTYRGNDWDYHTVYQFRRKHKL